MTFLSQKKVRFPHPALDIPSPPALSGTTPPIPLTFQALLLLAQSPHVSLAGCKQALDGGTARCHCLTWSLTPHIAASHSWSPQAISRNIVDCFCHCWSPSPHATTPATLSWSRVGVVLGLLLHLGQLGTAVAAAGSRLPHLFPAWSP